jgi:hypothetical protein
MHILCQASGKPAAGSATTNSCLGRRAADLSVMDNGERFVANGLMELRAYPAIRSPGSQQQQELSPARGPAAWGNGA